MMEYKLHCWVCREPAELRDVGRKNAECPACKHFFSCEELAAFEAGMRHIAGPLTEAVGEAAGKAAASCRRVLVEEVARWLRGDEAARFDHPRISPRHMRENLAALIRRRFGTPEETPK